MKEYIVICSIWTAGGCYRGKITVYAQDEEEATRKIGQCNSPPDSLQDLWESTVTVEDVIPADY